MAMAGFLWGSYFHYPIALRLIYTIALYVYYPIVLYHFYPIERGFILELRKWQALCLDSEGQWLFPSPVTGRPYHADSIRTDYLVPTGLKLGLGRIGFHTFRHTYRAWLDETGAPVGVQQKLMRHAHVSTTMDQYGNASALAKRKANRPIVQRLLRRSATQQISIQ
jgi:integrase